MAIAFADFDVEKYIVEYKAPKPGFEKSFPDTVYEIRVREFNNVEDFVDFIDSIRNRYEFKARKVSRLCECGYTE